MGALDAQIAAIKGTLKDAVKDVRASKRLTDSPVCLVADEGDMDLRLARLLKSHGRIETVAPRVLEINPGHPLIRRLAGLAARDSGAVAEPARLLLDQARIVEGEPLPDPAAFGRRLAEALERGLAG
jgi:molecular chaperone HtpG